MIVRYLKDDELTHHGVKGQKWGVRRYQNPDGTLTNAGKKRLLKQLKDTEGAKTGSYYFDKKADDLIRKYVKREDIEKYKKALKREADLEVDLDEYVTPDNIGSKKFQKKADDYDKAYAERQALKKQITTQLLGKYQNKRVSKFSIYGKRTGKDVVENILNDIAYTELDAEEIWGMPYDKIPEIYK